MNVQMKRKITFPVVLKCMSIIILGVLVSCTGREKSTKKADVVEQSVEWIALFDGETLDGWKRYGADEIGPLWAVEDGAIKCDGKGHGEGSPEFGGSLITLQTFGNFELELEWRISDPVPCC